MRFGLAFFSCAALAALSTPARAEGHAPALVRLLHQPGITHPLADGDGRLPVSVVLPPGADARALGLLPVAPGVGAVRLSPAEVAPFAAAHPELRLGVAPRVRPLLDVSPKWTRVNVLRAVAGGVSGQRSIVGIVDTGIDVRHPDFRTAKGNTRIAWLLAPLPPRGVHKDLEDAFGCTDPKQSACAVYSAADIDQVIASNSDELDDPDGHGTHVASIAAGNGGPSVTSEPRYVGLAPDATLIVAAPPLSTGFADTDILNATRFVFQQAASMGLPAGCSGTACVPVDCPSPEKCTPVPVVVNLSLGSDYGAHDGTGTLEKGLSTYVGDAHPGQAIVVAAGNSGDVVDPGDGSGPFGIHTEAHVSDGELVRVPMVATTASMNGSVFVWITFRSGDDVSVGLEGPGKKTWVGLTGKGDQNGYQSGSNQGGVVNDLPSANGSITADTNSAVVVFTGPWDAQSEFTILLRGQGDASLWLTSQQDAAQSIFFEKALRHGTINVPATAPALLAVGCTVNRVSWTPLGAKPVGLPVLGDDPHPVADSACFFSAEGPTFTGVLKPEISAPGAFVAAAMSSAADPRVTAGGLFDMAGCPSNIPYCAVVDDRHAIAAGTSMSAPHVAGAVALLMDLDVQMNGVPTLTQDQLTQALQAGARHPTGHVPDPDQLGPGALDVDSAHIALFDAMSGSGQPDPQASWYALSDDHARPDESWPVWGTIELRRADGGFAAVDGSKLTLSLQGGKLYQDRTRVRQGLFRFAVAGRPEDRGQSITVDVLYDGVSLGQRTLPVGWDVWSAEDPAAIATSGACSSAGTRSGSAPRGILPAALAGALALVRRRRRSR